MVNVDKTHPAHPAHPEHPDNHPHRAHHAHADNLRLIAAVFVGVTLLLMIVFGLLTNAPAGNVALSFAPIILFGLIAVVLLNNDRFDLKFLLLALIILLVLTAAGLPLLIPGADIASVLAINLVLGALFLVILAHSHQINEHPKVIETTVDQEDVFTLVATIEDRCKAINFVIGRVYSVHKGATSGVRDKIKIDSAWYNELSQALEDPDAHRAIVHGVVERIRRRLAELHKQENEVFSPTEVSRLKKLERADDGSTHVIDVLADNDSDPVDQYVASAEEFCDIVLERLDG